LKGKIVITNKRLLFEPTYIEQTFINAHVHDYMYWQMKVHPTIEGKNKRRITFDYFYILKNKWVPLGLGIPASQDPQDVLDLLLKLTSEKAETKEQKAGEGKKKVSVANKKGRKI